MRRFTRTCVPLAAVAAAALSLAACSDDESDEVSELRESYAAYTDAELPPVPDVSEWDASAYGYPGCVSPDNWTYLKKQGYTQDVLVDAGYKTYYDADCVGARDAAAAVEQRSPFS